MQSESQFKALKESQNKLKVSGEKGTKCICAVCGDKFNAGAGGVCALTCKNHRSMAQRKAYFEENEQV
jgi:hypothetical protein